jgi:hypothetical protein
MKEELLYIITYVGKGGVLPSEWTPWKKNDKKWAKTHLS